MTYEPRRIAFLGREGRVKHYRIALAGGDARSELADMASVWELEAIDFERRAWLHDVLEDGDLEAYLDRALEPTLV
jgi:hypothetical protein